MEPALQYDDQHLPPVKTVNYRKWFIVAIILVFLAALILVGSTMLRAEEKLVVCPSPYIDGDTCASDCKDECSPTLFANNKPVCFECKPKLDPLVEADGCAQGLSDSQSVCNASCNNGSCTVYNTVGSKSCYICVQCARGTFGSLSSCEDSCDTACAITAEKGDAKCYSCDQ